MRTARAVHDRASGATAVHGGVRGLKLLKTTQSGYSGFIHDELTTLPDCRDRIVASAVTATCVGLGFRVGVVRGGLRGCGCVWVGVWWGWAAGGWGLRDGVCWGAR